MKNRIAKIERITKETKINAEINLDGQGVSSIKADLPFLEHMLEQVARHGMFDLTIAFRLLINFPSFLWRAKRRKNKHKKNKI